MKQTAVLAAKNAGEILRKEFKSFDRHKVRVKGYSQIVTTADRKAEAAIIGLIKKAFPGHHILSEEAGDNRKKSDYFWIIDPLDGTTNFSFHNPFFSVSIALAWKEEVVLAAVYIPMMGEMYVAEKGRGAFRNGKKIHVSDIVSGRVIHTFCHGSTPESVERSVEYYRQRRSKDVDCRQLGSASAELAYVAAGYTESITIPGAKKWDVAAGVLLVREAGGLATDAAGSPWTLESRDMIATNGLVHGDVLRVLNKAFKRPS